jgi:hypothetical protein
MSHWQALSLTPDADERSIKRAYARLLKIHRPDENPDEFQRLREAYETALNEARWRDEAEGDVMSAAVTQRAPATECYQPEETSASVISLGRVDTPTAANPPAPSLEQIEQWLVEGHEPQVIQALRLWVSSDALASLESRQQFEQRVLDWLESASQWSRAFFDDVCQIMGWDESQGVLPCDYWRWNSLIQRSEAQALVDSIRADLARFDADGVHGQAAALLFKPLSDCRRREMADGFSSLDWQRFSELAQAVEYPYPQVSRRLGLQPLDNWRDWLPGTFSGVELFLWLALGVLFAAMKLTGQLTNVALNSAILMPLAVLALYVVGRKAYHLWAWVAVAAGSLDVRLSRLLLPRRWYRQGAGLLLLRHILPSAVPAVLASAWSSNVPWLHWASPMVMFIGTVYLTNKALSRSKVSMWTRALRALKRSLGRLPWHLPQREILWVVLAVAVMAASTYSRMK